MTNKPSTCILDDTYKAIFDRHRWLYLTITNGPTLNFKRRSAVHLHTFLNDSTQQSSTISTLRSIERSSSETITLHLEEDSYPFSAIATQRLRDFLNEMIGDTNNHER
jgi:hypothetical protein